MVGLIEYNFIGLTIHKSEKSKKNRKVCMPLKKNPHNSCRVLLGKYSSWFHPIIEDKAYIRFSSLSEERF